MKTSFGILILLVIKAAVGNNDSQNAEFTPQDNPNNLYWREWMDEESCSECGIKNPPFLNRGKVANPPNKYPWLVHLQRVESLNQKRGNLCGGALINEYFILTAAHCCAENSKLPTPSQPDLLKVHFVTKSISKLSRGPEVEEVHIHPGYQATWSNDVCLLKLTEPVQCNANVRTICLPPPNLILPPGIPISVAGWGSAKMLVHTPIRSLREVKLQVIEYDHCDLAGYENDMLICLGPYKGMYTCTGDSGVPLFKSYQDRNYILGVYSGRIGEDCDQSPKVANDVSRHLEWIHSITGIMEDDFLSGARFLKGSNANARKTNISETPDSKRKNSRKCSRCKSKCKRRHYF